MTTETPKDYPHEANRQAEIDRLGLRGREPIRVTVDLRDGSQMVLDGEIPVWRLICAATGWLFGLEPGTPPPPSFQWRTVYPHQSATVPAEGSESERGPGGGPSQTG